MERKNMPIGVMDSGVGGVSVLREMVELLPHEDFWFLGDSANAPYGEKSMEEIRELVFRHVGRMAETGIKAIVIACNTATSAAIAALREKYTDIPVVGIEPALKPAALSEVHPRVIVMGTPATVKAEKFNNLLRQYRSQAEIIPIGCKGLMQYVEAGKMSGPETEDFIRGFLKPYMDRPIDDIVLGCTHYPFLRSAIRNVVGPDTNIIDGSYGTAHQLARRLKEMDLLTDREEKGKVVFENSIPEKNELARRLLLA